MFNWLTLNPTDVMDDLNIRKWNQGKQIQASVLETNLFIPGRSSIKKHNSNSKGCAVITAANMHRSWPSFPQSFWISYQGEITFRMKYRLERSIFNKAKHFGRKFEKIAARLLNKSKLFYCILNWHN